METVAVVIRGLREERGWTLAELSTRLSKASPPIDLDKTQLSKRENGETRIKPVEYRSFASVFGLTIEQFENHWRSSQTPRTVGGEGIPVINSAPAGVIVDYEEYGIDCGQGHRYVGWGDIDDDLAFVVQVVGDSMLPSIKDGDILIFTPMNVPRPKGQVKTGESVVFVRFGPECKRPGCTLARWGGVKDGMATLLKDNPKHKSISCRTEDIEQLALCIERRTRHV